MQAYAWQFGYSILREIYNDFKEYTTEVNALRAINCKATKRTGYTELVIRNYQKRPKLAE